MGKLRRLIFLVSALIASQAFGVILENLKVTGNTISSLNSNGDVIVDANGTGRLLLSDLTALTVPYLDSSKRLQSSSVTSTQLGYLGVVTSNLCGISDACTLTNKTLTSPTISTPSVSGGTFSAPALTNPTTNVHLLTEQGSTPSTPSAGTKKLYAKNNGKVYTLDSAGLEAEVGSGAGGGSANVLTNPGFEDANATTGWTINGSVTCSPDTSDHLDDAGKQSISCTMSTFNGEIIRQCYTASASGLGFENTLGVKTSLGVIEVCSEVDGVVQQCRAVEANAPWKLYPATSITAATKNVCVLARTTTTTGIGVGVKFDSAYVGLNRNIGTVAQAKYIGSVTFGDDCDWTVTSNSSFANYANDTTCTTTADSNGTVTAISGVRPGAVIPWQGPGFYEVIYSGLLYKQNTSAIGCSYRFYDGTNALGYGMSFVSGTQGGVSAFAGGRYYSTPTGSNSITVDIQATGDGSSIACDIANTPTLLGKLIVKYVPAQSQTVVRADQTNWGWTDFGAITVGATTTSPTKGVISVDKFRARRDGENLFFTLDYTQTGSSGSASGSGDYLFQIPTATNCTADTTNRAVVTTVGPSVANGASAIGSGYVVVPGTSTSPATAILYSTTQFRIATGSTYVGSANYQLGQATVSYSINGMVRCSNWVDNGKAPQLPGGISTDENSNMRMCSAYLSNSGTPSISSQYGSCFSTSLTDNGTGDTTVPIIAGKFSSAPHCWDTVIRSGSGQTTFEVAPTTSSLRIRTAGITGTAADDDVMFFCWGPR